MKNIKSKLILGICKIDGSKCNSESLICHLNPTETNPIYLSSDLGVTDDKPFYNRFCSNFKKKEENFK